MQPEFYSDCRSGVVGRVSWPVRARNTRIERPATSVLSVRFVLFNEGT